MYSLQVDNSFCVDCNTKFSKSCQSCFPCHGNSSLDNQIKHLARHLSVELEGKEYVYSLDPTSVDENATTIKVVLDQTIEHENDESKIEFIRLNII